MQEERLKYLFDRYFQKQATAEELEEFFAMAQLYENEKVVQELMEEYWNSFVSVSKPFSEKDRDLMLNEILHVPTKQTNKEIRRVRLWPRVAAIAAAVAVIVSGIYFFNYKDHKADRGLTDAYIQDIAPGKFGATLTLANGKKINLTNAKTGEVAEEAGISITKTADGQVVYGIKENSETSDKINTLTTAKGETYILILPDKSKIWMNAASSLTYSTALNERGQRRVKLSGEAYFEISKDKSHPFVVESRGQEVEVLGTHFNVNAYDDEINTSTTLLEGSVRIQMDLNNNKVPRSYRDDLVTLTPGQQSVVSKGRIQVIQADTEQAVAWKNGMFSFKSTDLKSIMRQMSRWYNVNIIYEGELPETLYTGKIYRSVNASQILNLLKYYQVKFRIENKNIIVLPN